MSMVNPGALRAEQRAALLNVARRTLQARLAGHAPPVEDVSDDALKAARGAFVTLRQRSAEGLPRLRGCIGTFEEDGTLVEVVARMAEAAALSDPRFSPVQLEELPELVIELSILSPRFEVPAAEVRVGVHGLYVSRGEARGVLLPQVAVEHGWDRETFLDQACHKAGLAKGLWRDPHTRIEAFTAEVFHEA